MFDKAVSKETFLLKYCIDRYKTQEVCDKSVDTCLPLLKIILDCFVTNKMLEKLDNFVFSNGDTFFDGVDSNIITFLSSDMGFNTIDLNNIHLNNYNFVKMIWKPLIKLDLRIGIIDLHHEWHIKTK